MHEPTIHAAQASTSLSFPKKIVVLATEIVKDAQVFFCRSASYKGSAPFSAIFEVCDVDSALSTDKTTGRKTLQVCCQWGDNTDMSTVMNVDIADRLLHAAESYCGQVVRKIDWEN